MYCKRCGAKLDDGASYCTSCGASQRDPEPNGNYGQPNYGPSNYSQPVYDSGSFGWFILGFLIPLAGLILWIVWLHDKPKSAKMAGLGALISFIFGIIIFPILMVFVFAAVGASTEAVLAFI